MCVYVFELMSCESDGWACVVEFKFWFGQFIQIFGSWPAQSSTLINKVQHVFVLQIYAIHTGKYIGFVHWMWRTKYNPNSIRWAYLKELF